MRSALALLLAAASVASAQYYNITSAPFNLIVASEDGTLNDTLSACHTGAGLESLCLSNSNTTSKPSPSDAAVFYFNTSVYSVPPAPSFGMPGILTWTLPSNPPYPSSVTFYYDPTTNTAFPIITPGSDRPQILAFIQQDQLTVQGYIDWSVDPPNGSGGWKEYYRWFVCDTYFSGYQYRTLTWGLGPDKPENPSCVSVRVTRLFV